MEGILPYVIVLILFVLGILFIVSPVSFIGGSWLRYFRWFGILGFIIMQFSEDAQKWMVRVMGVLYILGALCFGGLVLTLGAVEGTVTKWEEEINAQQAAYDARLASEGPGYMDSVVQGLRQQKPTWFVEKGEDMMLVVTDTQTLLQAEYDLEWDFMDEASAADAVNSVMLEVPGEFEWDRQMHQEDGSLQQVLNDRRAKYGPLIMAAQQGGGASAPAQPTGEMTPDQIADMHIQRASERWRANDLQTSMKHAQEAWRLRVQTYGQGHPKVVEVENMIRAAQQRLAAAAPQPGP